MPGQTLMPRNSKQAMREWVGGRGEGEGRETRIGFVSIGRYTTVAGIVRSSSGGVPGVQAHVKFSKLKSANYRFRINTF